MKITGPDLLKNKVIDGIVQGTVGGGAPQTRRRAMAAARQGTGHGVEDLEGKSPQELATSASGPVSLHWSPRSLRAAACNQFARTVRSARADRWRASPCGIHYWRGRCC